MKLATGKLGVFLLVGIVFLSGCSKVEKQVTTTEDQAQTVTEPITTEPISEDPAAGTSPKIGESTARAMAFDKLIEGIVSITLKDIEGNNVERTFSVDEIASIETAFNDSFIMDTAYIEMLAGDSMTILLENGEEVFITSYGDENYIVARVGDGETYHLGCEVIAKILLERSK